MNVLLLAPHPFYSERGTPIAARAAAETLCRAGYRVDVLTYHEGQDLEHEGLGIIRIRKPPFVANVPVGLSWKKLVCDLYLIADAFRLLRSGRYHVVHAIEESVFPMAAARALRQFRLVYDMDSLLSSQLVEARPSLGRIGPVFRALEAWAIRRSDLILAVCPAIAEHVADIAPEKPTYVTHDVPLVPDATRQPAEDLRASLDKEDALALYVGNLEQYQGIELLLGAMTRLGECGPVSLAVIGGDAVAVKRYRARAGALGVGNKVHFYGPRPLRSLPAYLEQADILVSPRLHGINTPMKVYAYLASGRPIVATDIPAHVQVLSSDCAVLVPPAPDAFADGMRQLAKDTELSDRLGESGARRSRGYYSRKAYEAILLSAYETLRIETPEGVAARDPARRRVKGPPDRAGRPPPYPSSRRRLRTRARS
jgi:glycosyltransferase involved in cell wall biosynthesis